MNLNNCCTAAFVGLEIHYYRFKKDYDKRGIVLDFNIDKFSEPAGKNMYGEEMRTDPYAIQVIVKSEKTNKNKSCVFNEEELQNSENSADNLIILKIKEMINYVEQLA